MPRISVIVNPRAGYWRGHPGEWSRLPASPGGDIQVFPTESLESLGRLFAEGHLPSDAEGPAVDVVAGGDGTLCRFLSWRRAHGRSAPVLLIPTGTMNVIASDLGMRRSSAWATLAAIRDGEPWLSVPRVTLDVHVNGEAYSGFSFETGFCSHLLKEFYARPNRKVYAVALALETVGRLLTSGAPAQDIREGGRNLNVQSYLASGLRRMVLGLRPFGPSPELPTLARVSMTRWQQRLSWWRLVSGAVTTLVERGALTLRPLGADERVTIETSEPANLDGEMVWAGGGPVSISIRRGATVDFIRPRR